MKYGLQCPVTSRILLSGRHTTTWDDFELELVPNADGVLAEVILKATGGDVGQCDTSVTAVGAAETIAVNVKRNESLHARLLATLQTIESFLCLYGNLENVHWNNAEAFFELETEGAHRLQRLAIQVTPVFDEPDVPFSPPQIDWILAKASRCRAMSATLSFFREGLVDVRQRRNISAFFNFYFVLEGLYSNGQFKSKAVKHEFGRNPILVRAIAQVIAKGFQPSMDGDEGILEWLRRIGKPCDVPSLIHLLVEARGDLHHYAGPRSSKGSPLMNERYLSLSQFALGVVQAVLPAEIEKMDPGAEYRQDRW